MGQWGSDRLRLLYQSRAEGGALKSVKRWSWAQNRTAQSGEFGGKPAQSKKSFLIVSAYFTARRTLPSFNLIGSFSSQSELMKWNSSHWHIIRFPSFCLYNVVKMQKAQVWRYLLLNYILECRLSSEQWLIWKVWSNFNRVLPPLLPNIHFSE